jgi:4-hydroxybenzoate polyprenyltransferase
MESVIGFASVSRFASALPHEAKATYRLVYRDLSASVIPGTLFSFSASVSTGSKSLMWLPCALIYFSLYIYIFCLANQMTDVREDIINKPDRPIPAGLWTVAQANNRFVYGCLLFVVVAALFGGWQLLLCAAGWIVTTVAYNYFGLDQHFVTKNIVFISIGTGLQLAAAWLMVAQLSSVAIACIVFSSIMFGTTINIQDFRDIDGDKKLGRRTLPLVVGTGPARVVSIVALLMIPLAAYYLLVQHQNAAIRNTITLLLLIINMYIGLRVWNAKTAADDHASYQLHTYQFCGLLLTPAVSTFAL